MRIPDGEWKLECSGEEFATLRSDKEFIFLVSLARIANAIKFGVTAHDSASDISPAADRQRVGAILYLAGLLHELIEFLDKTKDVWGGLTAYHALADALEAADLSDDTRNVLDKIRNRTAFHFNVDVAQRVVPTLLVPDEGISFIKSVGTSPLAANYDFADLVTFFFIFGDVKNPERMAQRAVELWDIMRALCVRVLKRLDSVLISRLVARGFRIYEYPDGTYTKEHSEADAKGAPDSDRSQE